MTITLELLIRFRSNSSSRLSFERFKRCFSDNAILLNSFRDLGDTPSSDRGVDYSRKSYDKILKSQNFCDFYHVSRVIFLELEGKFTGRSHIKPDEAAI